MCGHIGCGRQSSGQHAEAHHRETNHGIAFCFSNKHAYCYLCEEYCVDDNRQAELELIRETLADVESQSYR